MLRLQPCEKKLEPLICAVMLRDQPKSLDHHRRIRELHNLLHKADGLLSTAATTETLEEAAALFSAALQLDGAPPPPLPSHRLPQNESHARNGNIRAVRFAANAQMTRRARALASRSCAAVS